jgi:hypothetical protein
MTSVAVVFMNQDAVRLILETMVDFNSYNVSTAKIWYKKPDGSSGSWDAIKLNNADNPASLGRIYVDFDNSKWFDQKGNWYLWSELTFEDGRKGYGVAIKYYVGVKGTP